MDRVLNSAEEDVRASLQKTGFGQGVEVLFFMRVFGDDSKVAVAKPMTFETVDKAVMVYPTIRIPNETAQAIMDELWALGFRPQGMALGEEAYNAQQAHLEDMRELAKRFVSELIKDKNRSAGLLDRVFRDGV